MRHVKPLTCFEAGRVQAPTTHGRSWHMREYADITAAMFEELGRPQLSLCIHRGSPIAQRTLKQR